MEPPIGLIAGHGQLPVLTARGIRAAGRRVVCVGFAGQTDPALPGLCDAFATSGMIRLGRWIRLLRRWGAREAVMVGGVRKTTMYDPLRLVRRIPDWRAAWLWYRVLRHDRRDQVVLAAVAGELLRHGIELIDTTRYIPGHLAQRGVMTRARPDAHVRADIAFAWPILMRINDLDLGQSLAVKDRDVIAVEAIEGTDAMIRRAGELCRSGRWLLVKGAGPGKDLRFDVPTVGVGTIQRLREAGASAVAVSAGRVILADKPAVLAAADAAKISLIGVDDDGNYADAAP